MIINFDKDPEELGVFSVVNEYTKNAKSFALMKEQ
jgi:hypothetical protein